MSEEHAAMPGGRQVIWDFGGLERAFSALRQQGYTTLGPVERDGALIWDEVTSAGDLPAGLVDEQEAGRYRLKTGKDQSLFSHRVGPHSLKTFLYPAQSCLFEAHRDGEGFKVNAPVEDPPRYAFIGAKACDTAALRVLDRVLRDGAGVEPVYKARRDGVFILAVDCLHPGGTCFCASMGTGPTVESDFDIALTELNIEGLHRFLARAGSENGERILAVAGGEEASEEDKRLAADLRVQGARSMGRELDTSLLDSLFHEHFDHPHWEEVAGRCLTCGNCTLVCPTCFCHEVVETTAVDGRAAERHRMWDTCFSQSFSYIHGGSIRKSDKSRYRQWMTHKLVTWMEQFGSRGCVGCGRCITWCPVGIDITAEAKAFSRRPPG